MSCTLGYHSDTKCVAVGVWSDPDRCRSDASVEAICGAAEAVDLLWAAAQRRRLAAA